MQTLARDHLFVYTDIRATLLLYIEYSYIWVFRYDLREDLQVSLDASHSNRTISLDSYRLSG